MTPEEKTVFADELHAIADRLQAITKATHESTFGGGIRHELGTVAYSNIRVFAAVLVFTPPPYP